MRTVAVACSVFRGNENAELGLIGLTITGGAAGSGGGILNDRGTVSIVGSTIVENTADGWGYGGGMYNNQGVVSVVNSVFEGNVATSESGAMGGGINSSGTLLVENSVFYDNVVEAGDIYNAYGGGICADGVFTLSNSIVWGNTAEGYWGNDGGISCHGEIMIANSTISHNKAMRTGGIGASEAASWLPSSLVINNTLIAENVSAGSRPDVSLGFETCSGTNNLIGDGSSQELFIDGVDGNQVGTAGSLIDPFLSNWTRLDDGSWGYHLLDGSPALDAGDNAAAVDAQGQPLTEDIQGNARIQNDTVDIGAVEGAAETAAGQAYLVTSLADVIDPADGELTFIEAFEAAQSNQPVGDAPGGSFTEQDVIEFADGVMGTIYLNGQAFETHGDLRIKGPGADLLRIDAQGESRLFTVRAADQPDSGRNDPDRRRRGIRRCRKGGRDSQ